MSNGKARSRQIRQQGTINEVVIITCRVDLPEHVYNAYTSIAAKSNLEIEEILQQQLLRCRDIVGSGIYFNESQKKRLSNVIGHTVADAEGALQRLETSTVIDVSGFSFELDPRLIQRLKTRVFRGEEYSDVMHREIVRALMTFAGMNPPLSNTGGWWRRGTKKPAATVANGNGQHSNVTIPSAKEAPDAKDRNLIPS